MPHATTAPSIRCKGVLLFTTSAAIKCICISTAVDGVALQFELLAQLLLAPSVSSDTVDYASFDVNIATLNTLSFMGPRWEQSMCMALWDTSGLFVWVALVISTCALVTSGDVPCPRSAWMRPGHLAV
jgi:hypothetical protein